MPEFFVHPAALPSLIGFLTGSFITSLLFAARLRSARAKARERENASDEQAAHLQTEKSVLENELATFRSSGVRFHKRQGELEALAKTDQKRQEEMAQFLGFAKSTLQNELRKHERAIIASVDGASHQQTPTRVTSRPPAPQSAPPSLPSPVPIAPAQEGAPHDDRDFVPIQPRSGKIPRETNFEGFVADQSSEKSESAANAFRAALDDTQS